MIGAKDLAFPKLNLVELVHLHRRRAVHALRAGHRRRRHRLDLLHARSAPSSSNTNVIPTALGIFITGFSSILTGLNFIVTIHRMRAPGMTWFRCRCSSGRLRDQPDHGPRHAGHRDHDPAGRGRAGLPVRHLRPGARRRPGALPAPVLVLLAPGGLHHGAAGDGRGQRAGGAFCRKRVFGYSFVAFSSLGDRRARLPGLGPPHVRGRPVGVRGADLLDPELPGRDSVGDQGLQLDGDDVQGLDLVGDADALRHRLHRAVHDRRPDRALPRGGRPRRARHRHLLHRRALPLHHGRRHDHGLPRRPALLVAEDHRPPVPRGAGQAERRHHLHRLQPDVLPAVHRSATWACRGAITRIRRSSRC